MGHHDAAAANQTDARLAVEPANGRGFLLLISDGDAKRIMHSEKGFALTNLPTRARWYPLKRDVAGRATKRVADTVQHLSLAFLAMHNARRIVMSPSFDFIFGKPAGDGAGRWIEGSAVETPRGYDFMARLMVRHPDGVLQCHRVGLVVDRPFCAEDFTAYVRVMSTGKFETVSRVLGLYETKELDPTGAAAIFEATAVWIDPWDHECVHLLQDLAALGDQLEQIYKRETLGHAIANLPGRTWTPVRRSLPLARDGD